MELFLGIDGGGTGCRAAIADLEGHVLGRGQAGPANIWTDPEGALASVLSAAAAAAEQASAKPAQLRAVLGLAGANMAGTGARLAERLPFAAVRVETDALVALKGALGGADGIAATLGTGSVFGVQRGGVARILGGWGFLLGDQGGGARIGRAVFEAALLAHDGLIEATPLLRSLLAEMGGAAAIVAFGQRAAPADFAREVPRVLSAEAAGDPAARAIMLDAAASVASAIDRLQADGPVPVCFLGGLGPEFGARLASRYPGMIRPPKGTGLDGALAMARGAA